MTVKPLRPNLLKTLTSQTAMGKGIPPRKTRQKLTNHLGHFGENQKTRASKRTNRGTQHAHKKRSRKGERWHYQTTLSLLKRTKLNKISPNLTQSKIASNGAQMLDRLLIELRIPKEHVLGHFGRQAVKEQAQTRQRGRQKRIRVLVGKFAKTLAGLRRSTSSSRSASQQTRPFFSPSPLPEIDDWCGKGSSSNSSSCTNHLLLQHHACITTSNRNMNNQQPQQQHARQKCQFLSPPCKGKGKSKGKSKLVQQSPLFNKRFQETLGGPGALKLAKGLLNPQAYCSMADVKGKGARMTASMSSPHIFCRAKGAKMTASITSSQNSCKGKGATMTQSMTSPYTVCKGATMTTSTTTPQIFCIGATRPPSTTSPHDVCKGATMTTSTTNPA